MGTLLMNDVHFHFKNLLFLVVHSTNIGRHSHVPIYIFDLLRHHACTYPYSFSMEEKPLDSNKLEGRCDGAPKSEMVSIFLSWPKLQSHTAATSPCI